MKKILSVLLLFILLYTSFTVYFGYYRPVAVEVRSSVQNRLAHEKGQFVPLSQIPLLFQHAVIDTEDRRFYDHGGIDPRGVLRALFTDTSSDQLVEGGSTITQQLVRNALLTLQKTWTRKIKEVILSLALEQNMTKDEILELYLNDIYYGHGAYGAGQAALTYFGHPLSQCTPAQLTLLAGIPNAPSLYDPFLNLKLAKQRQKEILTHLVESGHLSQTEADTLSSSPIQLLHS